MSTFNLKMSRTRRYNEDGSIIYNTMNASGLENKYKNVNSRFNTNHQKIKDKSEKKCSCTIAGCGKQCCFNYFLIERIYSKIWEDKNKFNKGENIKPGTVIYGAATLTSPKEELGVIDEFFFPYSNSCIPLPLGDCDCSGNFPISVRLIIRSTGNSCVINLKDIGVLFFDSNTKYVDKDDEVRIILEQYKVLGNSRKGKPYRAPLAGYRKALACCEGEKVKVCNEYCLMEFCVDDIVGQMKKNDKVYLIDGTYYGTVESVSGKCFTIKFKLGNCNDKLKEYLKYVNVQTKKGTFLKQDGTFYQRVEDVKIIDKIKECKNVTNDVYKDPYVESCSNPKVCYDKRIRSGMQPKQKKCCKDKSCEKKYSYSYSQYNKNRVMNTYERGLEKNPQWNPQTKEFIKCVNTYFKSSGGACLATFKNCEDAKKNKTSLRLPSTVLTTWKPNNNKFKKQGAVSAGSRLERLKLDTIKSANSKCAKGQRCDTIDCEKIPNGVYFAGKPRFTGWIYNARHRERVWPNKNISYIRNRPQPLGIPQTTYKGRSTSSNFNIRSKNPKSQGTKTPYQRSIPGRASARNLRAPGYGPNCVATCASKCNKDNINFQTQINNYVGANNARYKGNIKCN